MWSLECCQGELLYLCSFQRQFCYSIILCFRTVILGSVVNIYRKIGWDFEFKQATFNREYVNLLTQYFLVLVVYCPDIVNFFLMFYTFDTTLVSV